MPGLGRSPETLRPLEAPREFYRAVPGQPFLLSHKADLMGVLGWLDRQGGQKLCCICASEEAW